LKTNKLINRKMISNYTVLSIPQWAIFAGITVMIYGWLEKKKIFGIIGSGILVALGLFAAYALASGLMMPESMLDISADLPKEELFNPDELPVEGRLIPFYWGLVFNGLFSLVALFAEVYDKRFTKPLKIITGLISVVLFFSMMAALNLNFL
jgi:magnesium-transporting ATPase (P-type)